MGTLLTSVFRAEIGRCARISYLLSQHSPKKEEGLPSVCEPGTLALKLVEAKRVLWDFTSREEHGHVLPYPIGPLLPGVSGIFRRSTCILLPRQHMNVAGSESVLYVA
jgi:hypothetical protein